MLGQHLEAGRGAPHHGRVERAAAQVVDGQRPPDRHRRAQHGGVVRRGGDRLGDQPRRRQAGRAGRRRRAPPGAARPTAPGGSSAPRRRAPPSCRRASAATCRSTAPITCGTGISRSPSSTTPSSTRRFGFGSKQAGSMPGRAFGVAADQQPAVGVEVDRRGQQRRAVEQQRPGPPVGGAHHGDRVRRAEVDAEHPHARHPSGHVRALRPRGVPALTARPAYCVSRLGHRWSAYSAWRRRT